MALSRPRTCPSHPVRGTRQHATCLHVPSHAPSPARSKCDSQVSPLHARASAVVWKPAAASAAPADRRMVAFHQSLWTMAVTII